MHGIGYSLLVYFIVTVIALYGIKQTESEDIPQGSGLLNTSLHASVNSNFSVIYTQLCMTV